MARFPSRRRFLQTMLAGSSCLVEPRLASAVSGFGAPPLPAFSTFTDVAAQAGLTQPLLYGTPGEVTYIVESMGGGCAFFDFDNDGWMDIFLLGGRRLENVPAGAGNRLYRNNRDGTFTDVTAHSGLADPGWATGVCVGDYDNNGWEDLFLTYYGHNRLYRNNGNGTFTDVTARAGLLHAGYRFGTGCTFLDFDRDGHLDLFVANYVDFDLDHAPKPDVHVGTCSYEGIPVYCGPRGLKAPRHALYRNNGDGSFKDVSVSSGIAAVSSSYGMSTVAFDADEDGWPDIFVACDSSPSLLFMNNHDGTFREEALSRGLAVSGEGQELGGMGAALGDYNLDGHSDLFRTHFQLQPSGLYRGTGQGEFEDVSLSAGIGNERRFVSWGAGMVDLDNDGLPDLFCVTGNVYPGLEQTFAKYPSRGPAILFRNLGNGKFLQMGDEAGPAMLSRHVSRGCAFGDFDNDGDLDILIMNQNEAPSLLRNDAPGAHHWLKVLLVGARSNRSAIGARVVVRYGNRVQVQERLSQSSYLSSNDPRLHFGLGLVTEASVEVHWPSGLGETFGNLKADQISTLREGTGTPIAKPVPTSKEPTAHS